MKLHNFNYSHRPTQLIIVFTNDVPSEVSNFSIELLKKEKLDPYVRIINIQPNYPWLCVDCKFMMSLTLTPTTKNIITLLQLVEIVKGQNLNS